MSASTVRPFDHISPTAGTTTSTTAARSKSVSPKPRRASHSSVFSNLPSPSQSFHNHQVRERRGSRGEMTSRLSRQITQRLPALTNTQSEQVFSHLVPTSTENPMDQREAAGFTFVITGLTKDITRDVFHLLLKTKWWVLISAAFITYASLALLFAAIYALDPRGFAASGDAGGVLGIGAGIINARPGHFSDIYFFSLQTLSTIGYGYYAPASPWVNVFTVFEAFVGLVFEAFITGSLFAKLSRPVARVAFAKHALVQTVNGKPHLVFRIANERRSPIINTSVTVTCLIKRTSAEGEVSFTYKRLRTDTPHMPLFVGGMRLRHQLNADSPLFGLRNASDFERLGVSSFQLLVDGTEEVYGHITHARTVYNTSQVLFGYQFGKMLEESSGKLTVHIEKLSDVISEEEAQAASFAKRQQRASSIAAMDGAARPRRPSFSSVSGAGSVLSRALGRAGSSSNNNNISDIVRPVAAVTPTTRKASFDTKVAVDGGAGIGSSSSSSNSGGGGGGNGASGAPPPKASRGLGRLGSRRQQRPESFCSKFESTDRTPSVISGKQSAASAASRAKKQQAQEQEQDREEQDMSFNGVGDNSFHNHNPCAV